MPYRSGNRAELTNFWRGHKAWQNGSIEPDQRRQPVFRRRQNEETKEAATRSRTSGMAPAASKLCKIPHPVLTWNEFDLLLAPRSERPASFIATSGNLVLNVIRFPSRFLQPAEKHLSAISRPIGIDDVAAGDGALQTCSMRPVFRNRKSCSRRPSRITAWARMPASIG